MLTFSHQRPNRDYILCKMGSGSFLLFYIWPARDGHHHNIHLSVEALVLLYSNQLPVPSWTPLYLMYLIPVRRHWCSSFLCNGHLSGMGSWEDGFDFHREGICLLAWPSSGAYLCINFRHPYCTWNIWKISGHLVIYLQLWPLSKGMSLLTLSSSDVWTWWHSANGCCCSSLSSFQGTYSYILLMSTDTHTH